MSTPDILLVGWWLLAVAGAVMIPLLARRQREINKMSAARLFFGNEGTGDRKLHTVLATTHSLAPPPAGKIILWTVALWAAAVTAGCLVALWLRYWTMPLLLTFHLMGALMGVGTMIVGISPLARWVDLDPLLARILKWRFGLSVVRSFFLAVGLLMATFGSYCLLGDLGFWARAVEGRVDWSSCFLDDYVIAIDGRPYNALRSACSAARIGELVRAEIAAGSGTIFHVEPIRTRSMRP